ncbi:MAG: hypothetical protein IJZ73_05550 [Clostridia bacterium]|nr:hypothetical protein [Clostridia bacterium]
MKNNLLKKLTAIILSLVLVIGIGVMVSACKPKDDGNDISFESATDYSVMGGIGLLNDGGATTQSVKTYATSYSGGNTLSEVQKNGILKNLAFAQNMVNQDVVKSPVTESDREGYSLTYTITADGLSGSGQVYVFHYNENTTLDGDVLLEGVVIFNGAEYQIIGEKEVDGNEQEFTFTIKLNELAKVVVEHETELNDNEFSYAIYAGSVKIYESSFEYEVNDLGNVKVNFELEVGEFEIEYDFEFVNVEGEDLIKVDINGSILNVTVYIRVTEVEGELNFEFVSLDGGLVA